MRMQRRLNFTNRKRISHGDVDIRTQHTPSGTYFSAVLDVQSYRFPSEASVYVEAYQGASRMRFGFGKVAHLAPPADLVLKDLDPAIPPLFRVLVVSSDGRIVGAAHKIKPGNEQEDEAQYALLPIRLLPLGEEIWSLLFREEDRPLLRLNSKVYGIEEKIRSDPLVQGAILPAAFRMVLERVLLQPYGSEISEDGESWTDDWVAFGQQLTGIPKPLEREDREAWIQECLEKFSTRHQFVTHIKKLSQEN